LDKVGAIESLVAVVGEDRELRIVQDVKLAFEILHPKRRVQPVCECRRPPVWMKADDASLLFIRAFGRDVHWVFTDKNAPVRRGANDGGRFDDRMFGDKFESPTGKSLWRLRSAVGGHQRGDKGASNNQPVE